MLEVGRGLRDFIEESNRIEGILRDVTDEEIAAHHELLALDDLIVPVVEDFVRRICGASLRAKSGMDVRVGSHVPPLGGPRIEHELRLLLSDVTSHRLTPFEAHLAYETLHPFMDGNGRSGRAVWAWQMAQLGQDPFALPFLHRIYYQCLDASGRV